MALVFNRDFQVTYGQVDVLSPLVRRVVAENPGPFTFTGTATFIIGHGEVAVIDPGPKLPAHLDALLEATSGEKITHILVTHTHGDHSPGSAELKAATGATTYGFGPHPRSGPAQPEAQRPDGAQRQEEPGDLEFVPDVVATEGIAIAGSGWTFEALHTPGHISNHVCYALAEEKALFSGDHVMGWSTSVIPPPDGSLTEYMASLRRLLERDFEVYYPTHGPPIENPRPFVEALIEHREERTRQIIERLAAGDELIGDMVKVIYADVNPMLHPAAARSTLAHLIHLVDTARVVADSEDLGLGTRFRLADGRA